MFDVDFFDSAIQQMTKTKTKIKQMRRWMDTRLI